MAAAKDLPSIDEKALKEKFAEELLRNPSDPFAAARIVAAGDSLLAIKIANEWIIDSEVLNFQAELLKKHPLDHFLPSKAELARKIIKLGDEARDTKDRLAAYKLAAELMGHLGEKNGTNVNVNVTQNRVMIVKDHGSDDEWERRAEEHQMKLIENARA